MADEDNVFRYEVGSKHLCGACLLYPAGHPKQFTWHYPYPVLEWTVIDRASIQKRGGCGGADYNCGYKLSCKFQGQTYISTSLNDGFVKKDMLDYAIEGAGKKRLD
nr:hypothetical protein [Sicyoidochytrium minutum DNA virus]